VAELSPLEHSEAVRDHLQAAERSPSRGLTVNTLRLGWVVCSWSASEAQIIEADVAVPPAHDPTRTSSQMRQRSAFWQERTLRFADGRRREEIAAASME